MKGGATFRGRRGGGPEHNLIQRPDLIGKLRDLFGIRQMHLSPTLTEGVQPVVVMADLGRESGDRFPVGYGWAISGGGDIGPPEIFAASALYNPPSSGVVVAVRTVHVSHQTAHAVTSAPLPARLDIWNDRRTATSPYPGLPPPASMSPGNAYWQDIQRTEPHLVKPYGGTIDAANVNNAPAMVMQLENARLFTWRPEQVFLRPGDVLTVVSEENGGTADRVTNELYIAYEWEERPWPR